jgi:hypothetical protein
VQAFQAKAGLSADGIVGPQTWAALGRGGASGTAPGPGKATGGGGGAAGGRGPSQALKAPLMAKVRAVQQRLATLAKAESGRAEAPGPRTQAPPLPVRQGWVDDVTDAAGEAYDTVTETASDVVDTVSEGASEAWDTAKEGVEAVEDAAGQGWEYAKEGAGEVEDAVNDVAAQGWEYAKEGANAVEDAAGQGWEYAKQEAEDIVDTVGGNVAQGWEYAKEGAEFVVDAAEDVAGQGVDYAKKGAKAVADTAHDVASNAWDTAKDVASDAWDTAKDVASDTWDAAKDPGNVIAGTGGGGLGGTGGATGGSAWDDVADAVNDVKGAVEGITSDLRERYGPQVDAFIAALNDLGKPLTADLDGVAKKLDDLLADLDPGDAANALGDDTSEPDRANVTFTWGSRVDKSSTLNAGSVAALKRTTEDASNAQKSSGTGFLSVAPSGLLRNPPSRNSKGELTKVAYSAFETVTMPRWAEYDAAKDSWHPLAAQAWELARSGMNSHEQGHLDLDQSWMNSSNLADAVFLKPASKVDELVKKEMTDPAQAANDKHDADTVHGTTGNPSTVVRVPTPSDVEEWNKTHPGDKGKKV